MIISTRIQIKKSGYKGQINKEAKQQPFDYWSWFKVCVNHLKIPPSEAWKMDLVEIIKLSDDGKRSDIDLSLMLNFERIKNGASKEWLLSR